ncbi:MAG TPA: aminopeptidase [Desulfobacteraceae bacterium]|nr:aminopeptidase [Desulfobacteraceae bacterium]HPJ66805.1 aminopeptidase [Desulfobacteraceae bacterium]HPQ27015.1 aminopeptidase [Desulfobacteraceae bacterium]
MLSMDSIERYSEVLLWGLKTARKVRFNKNEVVLIRFDLAAIKLAEILQEKIMDMGLNPVLRMGLTPVMEHNFYSRANKNQLVFNAPGEKELYENLNGSIYLNAPESLTHLSDIDPKKIGKAAVARKPLRDLLWEREDRGEYGWTLCTFPTDELAKQAGLSIEDYSEQIIRACYLDRQDPVKAWKGIYKDAMSIKNWLNSMDVKYFHVESEHTDLKIRPGKQRKWVGISGHNIPSFELFISPDWRGTEGIYYADQPSFRSGNYVKGVKLVFSRGSAAQINAGQGEEFVVKQLSMDKGAGRVGEFSLTDKRFSRIDKFMANTLYDENYGGDYGNCHIAAGSSYSDTYDGDPAELTEKEKKRLGFNDSALHWDLVNTEKKTVTAFLKNGRKTLIYENGMFNF